MGIFTINEPHKQTKRGEKYVHNVNVVYKQL